MPANSEYHARFPDRQEHIRWVFARVAAERPAIVPKQPPTSRSDVGGTELPTHIGRYRIERVLGRGGFAVVYKAHDDRLNRPVAIKILTPEISHDARANERFLREARAVAVIRHKHVVMIYAVEKINRIPALVMELVDGPSLEDYLRASGMLPTAEVVILSHQIAQGLEAAHEQGVIHRDIKPANILLERIEPQAAAGRLLSNWEVKITDFGLARVAAEVSLTVSGLIGGTPQYMSPEQAIGQQIDLRSDLFSLGSVMYRMCAGRAAFEAESAVGILRQVADEPPRSLREVSPETPDWLIGIIDKLMAKSPNERFQSAAEVTEVLGRHLHGLQNGGTAVDSAAVPEESSGTDSPAHHRPRTVALIALTVVGIATATMFIGKLLSDSGGHSSAKVHTSQHIPRLQVAKLLASDGTAGNRFGYSVSHSEDTVVIGAPYDDDAGEKSGSAYVFTRSGMSWIEQSKLIASDAEAGEFFGFSVSLSGDTVVIGAPNDDDAGEKSGSVYVFTLTGTTWIQQAKLTAHDGSAGDTFGHAVSIDGDTVLVGASADDVGPAYDSGSAYVFTRRGTTWTQQAKLVAPDCGWGDYFGFRVDVDGDTAVVGAWQDDNSFTDSGAAYVFARSGATWTLQSKLTARDATNIDGGDLFGVSVAVFDGTIVVGSMGNDAVFTNSGAAYVFTRSGATWSLQAKLTPADAAAFDFFGFDVSVRGDTLLVATEDAQRTGAVYVFTRSGKTWTEQIRLIASDRAVGDSFAQTCVSNGMAMVGAWGDDDNGMDSGSVYVFGSGNGHDEKGRP